MLTLKLILILIASVVLIIVTRLPTIGGSHDLEIKGSAKFLYIGMLISTGGSMVLLYAIQGLCAIP